MSMLLGLLSLFGCDQQRINQLKEGVSSEADVRQQFGAPAQVIERADGSRVLSYPRQPEGSTNYEIVLGADGKMSSLRQLLTPENFAKVQAGMSQDEVGRLLGRHAATQRYASAPTEEVWEWRFVDGGIKKVFTVRFGADGLARSSHTEDDPREVLPTS
jgi:hypothetical protein